MSARRPGSTDRSRPGAVAWILAFAALLMIVGATYRGTLRQFFIADDFAHLRFLHEARAPLWRYLDPTFTYSDPVTMARYLPVKIYILLFLERTFGLDAAPYHALSIVVHALNALLVGTLGGRVFGSRAVAALAALLFATSRLDAQNVCWMVCIPNLLGATFVLAAVALYLRPRSGAVVSSLGAALLCASFVCRSDAAATVVFLVPLWVKDAVIDRRRGPRWFAITTAILTVVLLALSYLNLRRFPEPRMRLGVQPARFGVFLTDLFVPWEVPTALKVIVVTGILCAAWSLRDRRVLYALYGIGVRAATWTAIVYLELTPRYFYMYTALSSLLLAALLERGAARVLGPRGPAAALAFGALVAGLGARAIAREDVVWFDYLSTPGRKLLALRDQQRAAGATAPLRVSMKPYALLTFADTAFFAPDLAVVRDGTEAVTVDTEAARFVGYYGRDFGSTFWYFPWFTP